MNQIGGPQPEKREAFEEVTYASLAEGLDGRPPAEQFTTLIRRLRERFEHDRHLLNPVYTDIIEMHLRVAGSTVNDGTKRGNYGTTVCCLVDLFTTVLQLAREVQWRDEQMQIERARTDEARSMVREMLRIEPCLQKAIQHLIQHDLYASIPSKPPVAAPPKAFGSPADSRWLTDMGFSPN